MMVVTGSLSVRSGVLSVVLGCAGAACNVEPSTDQEVQQSAVSVLVRPEAKTDVAKISTPANPTDIAKPSVTVSQAATTKVGAAPVAPFLLLAGSDARGLLRVGLNQLTTFKLNLPDQLGWQDVYVGNFHAAIPNGDTESIRRDAKTGEAVHTFRVPGSTAIALCVGPKSIANKSNAWALVTRCTKFALQVGASGRASLPLQKFGQPIEVRPMTTLERLDPGAPLPLLFYYESQKQLNTPVEAHRPDGSIDRRVTNGTGVVEFDVTQPGRWAIRIVKASEGGERIGELVFDVGGAQ